MGSVTRFVQFLVALLAAVGSYAAFGWGGVGVFAAGIVVGFAFATGEQGRRVRLRALPDNLPARTVVEEELPAYPADRVGR